MIDVFNILGSYVTNFDCISVLMLKSLLLTIYFALFTGIVFFKVTVFITWNQYFSFMQCQRTYFSIYYLSKRLLNVVIFKCGRDETMIKGDERRMKIVRIALSSGLFTGICNLSANISEHTVCYIFIGE
jgi:hypothetical protein